MEALKVWVTLSDPVKVPEVWIEKESPATDFNLESGQNPLYSPLVLLTGQDIQSLHCSRKRSYTACVH